MKLLTVNRLIGSLIRMGITLGMAGLFDAACVQTAGFPYLLPAKIIRVNGKYYVWYTHRQTPTPPRGTALGTDTIPSTDWDLAEICRRRRSPKEWVSSGAGGFCRSFWISSGSSKRFISWATRARERPSLAAILALVIPELHSISWRQRQAWWYGCMQPGSTSPWSHDSEANLDKMPLGNMMGSTMYGSAPQRENGIARIREWSQEVRICLMAAEPISKSLSSCDFLRGTWSKRPIWGGSERVLCLGHLAPSQFVSSRNNPYP